MFQPKSAMNGQLNTEERCHNCKACNKAFSTVNTLRLFKRRLNSYYCRTCFKYFFSYSCFRVHKRSHIRSSIQKPGKTAEKWSSQKNLQFVKAFKEQANLWNRFDPNYRNENSNQVSLKRICREMNLQHTSEVIKKFKSLRCKYYKQLLKTEKCKRRGRVSEANHKPLWFYTMDYIMRMNNFKGIETRSNMQPLQVITNYNEMPEKYQENSDTSCFEQNSSIVDGARSPRRPPSIIKSPLVSSEIKSAINELNLLNNSLLSFNYPQSLISPCDAEEECKIIGQHVAWQLKQLPQIERISAKDEIQILLSKYRMKTLFASEKYPHYLDSRNVESFSNLTSPPVTGSLPIATLTTTVHDRRCSL